MDQIRFAGEKINVNPFSYYYMVERTYVAVDGRRAVGVSGFDGGLLGTPEFDAALDTARREAYVDACVQLGGTE